MITIDLDGNAIAMEKDFVGHQAEAFGPYQIAVCCGDCHWRIRDDEAKRFRCCPKCGGRQFHERVGRWKYRLIKGLPKYMSYSTYHGNLSVDPLCFICKDEEAHPDHDNAPTASDFL